MSDPCEYWTSRDVLNAVEKWANGFVMLRETGAIFGNGGTYGTQRVDGLLIPLSWEAASYAKMGFKQGLVAVEVKISRSDFNAGIRKGQFEDYAQMVSGLYIATPKIVRTREVPKPHGHIVVVRRGEEVHAVCKRHPVFEPRDLSQTQLWRILWSMAKWHNDNRNKERRALMELKEKYKDRFGQILGRIEDDIRKQTKQVQP